VSRYSDSFHAIRVVSSALARCLPVDVHTSACTRRYPDRVQGARFGNYIDWMVLSWSLTLTSCPVMSVPIGFSSSGLPIGLQIMAAPFCEPVLLAAAAAYEAAHPTPSAATPTVPRRMHTPFQADFDGPRTIAEAQTHAEGEGATLAHLFSPLPGSGVLYPHPSSEDPSAAL
jgi:hypothetical protein